MSRKNPYLFYTEYYLISSAYRVVNILNDILKYSASYSDNVTGYLHSRVVSKQIMLNEMIHHNNHHNAHNSNGNNNNDVDEDGFVVIKMRKPKLKNDSFFPSIPIPIPITENKNIECNNMTVEHDDNNDDDLQTVKNMLNGILDHIDFQNYEI